MTRYRIPLLVCTLVVMSLAGCIGEEDPTRPTDPPVEEDPKLVRSEDGRDLRTELEASDELPAPEWRLGEAFGIHIYFGTDDTQGTHMDAVVAEDRGDKWYVAPDDPDVAKEHAAFQFPFFGEIAKADLASQGFGADWRLFQFPLTDGQAWQDEFTVPSFSSFDTTTLTLDFLVNYEAQIDIQGVSYPGFRIMGHNEDGDMVMEYSYAPQIGWLAHFWLYDLNTEDPSDYLLHIMNMGHTYNWTGEYYLSTAEPAIEFFSHTVVDPATPGLAGQQRYPEEFDVPEGTTYVFGFFFSFAVGGANELILIDPTNEVHQTSAGITNGAGPMDGDFQFGWIDEDAKHGTWRVGNIGAGIATGGAVFLWSVTEATGSL